VRVRAAGLGLLLGALGLGFGLNTVEPYPCYRYACGDSQNTFRWIDQVEVWVAKDVPQESRELLLKALSLWSSVAGIEFIYRGETNLTSDQVFDPNTCYPNSISNPTGIIFALLPQSCGGLEAGRATMIIPTQATQVSSPVGVREGVNDLRVFVHEIGHAIGLGHPFDFGESDAYDDPNATVSVMQYTHTTMISYDDAEVAQYLYGTPQQTQNLSLFFSSPVVFYDYQDAQGVVCATGGTGPYAFQVQSGNCTLIDIQSPLCKGVSGEGDCSVSVVDSQGTLTTLAFYVPATYTVDTPTTVVEGSDGGGGGGGCNTGAEAGLGTLVALVLYALRRVLS